MNAVLRPLAATAVLLVTLTGCNVSSDKHGDKNNVQIGTPFGSMHIKTDNGTDTSAIGIDLYPGAKPYKDSDEKDDDSNSADINLSFGDFHLGVKAASYITPDNQDKVIAFYKKDLARYGEVLTCRGSSTIGTPDRTSQGLTCADKDHNHITTGSDVKINGSVSSDDLELRAGSDQHQHIVGIKSKDGGTKIGLVALDLPSHLGSHDDNGKNGVE
jgi:hypothetical protein